MSPTSRDINEDNKSTHNGFMNKVIKFIVSPPILIK